MILHFILLITAVIIFLLVFYMLWKYGRISRQDVLALTAVIISLAIGLFTFLSRSLPVEIDVFQTSTTLFSLPEENKSLLISESLYYDLKNNISPQANKINQELRQNGIDVQQLSREDFYNKTKDTKFNYNPLAYIAKEFIGKDPCSIPIVFSLSFVNKTPNPVVIDELYFIVENETERLIYKPMFFVDSHKLFTNSFKKTNEVLTTPFHPFLLTENTDKELHLFCIKWNLKDDKGISNSIQLGSGEYKIDLHYRTSTNKKYSKKLPPINLIEKDLIDLYNGSKISIGNESEYYKELLENK